MDFMFQQLVLLKAAHPIIYWIVIVIVVVPVINIAIWFSTTERWTQIVAKNPRLAAFLQVLDALGLNPIKLLIRFYTMITGQPWVPPHTPVVTVDTATPHGLADESVVTVSGKMHKVRVTSPTSFEFGGSPKKPGIGTRIAGAMMLLAGFLGFVFVLGQLLAGCSALPVSKLEKSGIDVGLCVFQELEAGLPFEQISKDCGNVAIEDLVRAKAAMQHIEATGAKKAAASASSAPSGCPR